MKLVTAHYLLGEPKIIFFTADVRVDFRVGQGFVSVFKIRIELRRSGCVIESRPRRPCPWADFCRHSVTDKLNSVSIKMAKEQNLSLNSMKISAPVAGCSVASPMSMISISRRSATTHRGSRLKVGYDRRGLLR